MPSSMPIEIICSMASVEGKTDAMTMRVPPPSSSMLHLHPGRGHDGFGLPASSAKPSSTREAVRGLDLDDVPLAAASRPPARS